MRLNNFIDDLFSVHDTFAKIEGEFQAAIIAEKPMPAFPLKTKDGEGSIFPRITMWYSGVLPVGHNTALGMYLYDIGDCDVSDWKLDAFGSMRLSRLSITDLINKVIPARTLLRWYELPCDEQEGFNIEVLQGILNMILQDWEGSVYSAVFAKFRANYIRPALLEDLAGFSIPTFVRRMYGSQQLRFKDNKELAQRGFQISFMDIAPYWPESEIEVDRKAAEAKRKAKESREQAKQSPKEPAPESAAAAESEVAAGEETNSSGFTWG